MSYLGVVLNDQAEPVTVTATLDLIDVDDLTMVQLVVKKMGQKRPLLKLALTIETAYAIAGDLISMSAPVDEEAEPDEPPSYEMTHNTDFSQPDEPPDTVAGAFLQVLTNK